MFTQNLLPVGNPEPFASTCTRKSRTQCYLIQPYPTLDFSTILHCPTLSYPILPGPTRSSCLPCPTLSYPILPVRLPSLPSPTSSNPMLHQILLLHPTLSYFTLTTSYLHPTLSYFILTTSYLVLQDGRRIQCRTRLVVVIWGRIRFRIGLDNVGLGRMVA